MDIRSAMDMAMDGRICRRPLLVDEEGAVLSWRYMRMDGDCLVLGNIDDRAGRIPFPPDKYLLKREDIGSFWEECHDEQADEE